MGRRRIVLALLPLLLAVGGFAAATGTADREAIFRAFEEGAFTRAIDLIEAFLEEHPDDPVMLYNLACGYSRTGDADAATTALYRAVQAGFRDFDHLRRDPDLEAIRDEPMYQAILEAAERVSQRRVEDVLDRWRAAYSDEAYRFEIDEPRRLVFATALDDRSHREMRQMLERQADLLTRTLFEAPPSEYVLIAVPTPDEADEVFGGDPRVAGRYAHAERSLVVRNIGSSLRHEFVHALHYGHMERLGLEEPHPIWIQEGLATLFESYEESPDGSVRFFANERHNAVRGMARAGRLDRWDRLFSMSADRFMRRPTRLYPQVRSVFEYLAHEGRLEAWYRTYVEHFDEDATGITAFEIVFDRPLEEIESAWRAWVRHRPRVDTVIEPGDASLGIRSAPHNSNDGVLIEQVLPGSAAGRSGLRRGDVIVALDGQSTRSLVELQQLIGTRSVGDRVTLRVRRRGEYFETEAVLRPLRGLTR